MRARVSHLFSATPRRAAANARSCSWIEWCAPPARLRAGERKARRERGPRVEARLELQHARDGVLIEGEQYELTLHSPSSSRFVYVFAIDGRGESVLLYPHDGSVENRFGARQDVVLDARFEVAPPFGVETFVLLTSDEPLSDPWVLERGPTRGPPETWSVETYVYRSVAAKKRHTRPSSVSEERTSSPSGIRRTSNTPSNTQPADFAGRGGRLRRDMNGAVQVPRQCHSVEQRGVRYAPRSVHGRVESRHLPLRRLRRGDRDGQRAHATRPRPSRARAGAAEDRVADDRVRGAEQVTS